MYRSFSVSSSICVDLISLVLLGPESSMKRVRSQNLYVQPRSRKIRSKIGIGIPRSQSKMYPVAPACLILFVKRISDILNVIDLELFVMRVNLLCLLKHTIGATNDCLIRKNPILHKAIVGSRFRDCSG